MCMKGFVFPLMLFLLIGSVITYYIIIVHQQKKPADNPFKSYAGSNAADTVWRGADAYQIPSNTDSGKLIRYGRELIANTARYLGPKGVVAHITNGMNCQNCHLEAGTLPFANNFGKVYATYPQFRARSGGLQSIYDRVNDCLERSLNGQAMDSTTPEMQAMYAYIQWLGRDISKGEKRGGTSLMKLPYLDVAADPVGGQQVYAAKCQSCHGEKGNGQPNTTGTGYTYPPLWGRDSYNDGAGLYRLSSFAGFVKNNMPFGIDYHYPALTDKEAWDVAAFVNSKPRPHRDQSADWKNVSEKPVDFPFGPYADTFSVKQHKYGPFTSIKQL
jgi:thiosulfate dehydrogenase